MSILGVMPMYIQDFLRGRGIWFEGLLYQPASSSAKRAQECSHHGVSCRQGRAGPGGGFVPARGLARARAGLTWTD